MLNILYELGRFFYWTLLKYVFYFGESIPSSKTLESLLNNFLLTGNLTNDVGLQKLPNSSIPWFLSHLSSPSYFSFGGWGWEEAERGRRRGGERGEREKQKREKEGERGREGEGICKCKLHISYFNTSALFLSCYSGKKLTLGCLNVL